MVYCFAVAHTCTICCICSNYLPCSDNYCMSEILAPTVGFSFLTIVCCAIPSSDALGMCTDL